MEELTKQQLKAEDCMKKVTNLEKELIGEKI